VIDKTRNRKNAFAIFAGLICLLGCQRQLNPYSVACEQGINRFHFLLDSEQYRIIYNEADEEFHRTTVEPDFVGGLKAVRDKLGPVKKSELRSIKVSWTIPQGETEVVIHRTIFANGSAMEQFMWRLRNNKAFLVGYTIDSNALKELAPNNGG
jgi:hypothetical protein